ncbi:MAG: hypothetical protein PHU46_04420 [Rhodocyclaceae bacterium]|nr:hypothetical protein [Rhodocyclaceae bacterium]
MEFPPLAKLKFDEYYHFGAHVCICFVHIVVFLQRFPVAAPPGVAPVGDSDRMRYPAVTAFFLGWAGAGEKSDESVLK